MDARKKQEIRQLADTVRESLQLSVPIDVESAVERLGGTLECVDTCPDGMEAEAMILRQDDSFQITIHNGKPSLRRRFSIAHELGHLFLHMGYLLDPDRWRQSVEYRDSVYYRFGYSIEEAEANEFAGTFLMPEDEFRMAVQQSVANGGVNVNKIANYFKTSIEAATTRGRSLGIFRQPV